MIDVTIVVNGDTRRASVPPETTLLKLLRENFSLTGAKLGCDVGDCGACPPPPNPRGGPRPRSRSGREPRRAAGPESLGDACGRFATRHMLAGRAKVHLLVFQSTPAHLDNATRETDRAQLQGARHG